MLYTELSLDLDVKVCAIMIPALFSEDSASLYQVNDGQVLNSDKNKLIYAVNV